MPRHYYTGTTGPDTITPDEVSPGVIANPPGSMPSDNSDSIDGNGGGDTLSGGGGNDAINTSGAGNVIHGDAGNDHVYIELVDTGGPNPVTNAAWGDGGNDQFYLQYLAEDGASTWHGQAPTGTITLHGGDGGDGLVVIALGVNGPFDLSGTTVFQYGDHGSDYLEATYSLPDPYATRVAGNNPDYLYGGPGDDRYTVYETQDVASEKAGEGYDAVFAYRTDYALGPNIETLTLYYGDTYHPSSEGYHGTGNASDNVIYGTDLNSPLTKSVGSDSLHP